MNCMATSFLLYLLFHWYTWYSIILLTHQNWRSPTNTHHKPSCNSQIWKYQMWTVVRAILLYSTTVLCVGAYRWTCKKLETHTSDFSLNSPLRSVSGGIQRIGSLVLRAEVYSKVSFASPKSLIFSNSLSPTRMLRQARSRWMTPFDSRYS